MRRVRPCRKLHTREQDLTAYTFAYGINNNSGALFFGCLLTLLALLLFTPCGSCPMTTCTHAVYAAAIGTVIGFVLASLFWAGRGHD